MYALHNYCSLCSTLFNAIAVCLLITATITINSGYGAEAAAATTTNSNITTAAGAVSTICNGTIYPDACSQGLAPYVNSSSLKNPSANNLVSIALRAAAAVVAESKVFSKACESSVPGRALYDQLQKQAIDDCVQLMQSAKDQLDLATSNLSSIDTTNMTAKRDALLNLNSWLSSALSYQTACSDGFSEFAARGKCQQKMAKRLNQVSEVLINSLDLVKKLAKKGDKLSAWNAKQTSRKSPPSPPRSLLDEGSDFADEAAAAMASDGFPSWAGNAEERRKLLLSPMGAPASSPTFSTAVPSATVAPPTVGTGVPSVSVSAPTIISPASSSPSIAPTPSMAALASSPAPTPVSDSYCSSADDICPDLVVALDGTGDFSNITDALNSIDPTSYLSAGRRFVVYIKAGLYEETFEVPKTLANLTFIGDGINVTVISASNNVASGLFTTFRSATVGINAKGFWARDMTFRNTAGPQGHQAVALRASQDLAVFYRCGFEGYQDTLYALAGRQFYRDCKIYGTVDFIFGNAIASFQNCDVLCRQPMQGQQNTITAQGRKVDIDISGYSFQNCTLLAAEDLQSSSYTVLSYLGRPWKDYSRVVFLQSYMDSLIQPAGWLSWNSSNPFTDTVYYGEYDNSGPGSGTSGRVNWTGVHPNLNLSEALPFIAENFILGSTWLPLDWVTYTYNLDI